MFFVESNAQINEKISFESANPFALSDIITDLENQKKQDVFGKLVIPSDSLNDNKKFPLIIAVAGSLGWREHHKEYLDMYQNSGFATFELNSFESRNIKSTVGSQVEVTTAAIILDAYRAFEKLANHPKIDKDKVWNHKLNFTTSVYLNKSLIVKARKISKKKSEEKSARRAYHAMNIKYKI